jgi:hypothetical protein
MDAQVERAARWIVILASIGYALAISWGLFARIGGGHDAQIATRAIVAENVLAWHILAPVKDYVLTRPTPDMYYVHHPWGMFWMIDAFCAVLGRGTWVPRLAGIVLSAAVPPMLYGIGRALWGPVPGAVTALAYTVLPIALAFGHLPTFEVPVIFGSVLATWGYLRFAQQWRRRWMFVSVAGMLFAVNGDWQGAAFVGVALGGLGMGRLFFPRWFGSVRVRSFAQWWILTALLCAATLLAYVDYLQQTGAIENLAHAESMRARGSGVPLPDALRARSYWIDVTFTPLAVTIGKIAAPIFLARVVFWRRLNEVFPLAILTMATLEYAMFKNGADVHIYWPLPFAPYWALSLGLFSAIVIEVARWIQSRRALEDRGVVALVSLGVFGLVAISVLPDGVRALAYAKRTAGRFNEKGHRIFNDADLAQGMEWMAARIEPKAQVNLTQEVFGREYRAQEWALNRPLKGLPPEQFVASKERYFIGDFRFAKAADVKSGASEFQMITLGPYYFLDRAAPKGPIEAYRFEEREPNFFQWYFTSPTEPMRTVRPYPWGTWELRQHFEQTPNPPPTDAPQTLDEIRIAHNAAVAQGDAAGAERLKTKLLAALNIGVASEFSEGVRLLGERYVPGVAPTLELYFQADGPMSGELTFAVNSNIEAPPRPSWVSADDKTKNYGPPFVLSPELWRKDFIYVDCVDVRRRLGREHFVGLFAREGKGTPPKFLNGLPSVALMTLE